MSVATNDEVAKPSSIRLRMVRIDGDTQTRDAIDEATVAEYEQHYRDGVDLPPIEVVWDGRSFWLHDGFHRYHAAKRAGLTSLPAISVEGTADLARWLACGANRTHGLKRSNADKRRAVSMALALKPEESNAAIAAHCGVSDHFVGDVRKDLTPIGSESTADRVTRTGRDGRKINTSRIGKRTAPPPKPEPKSTPADSCAEQMERAEEAIKEAVALVDEALRCARELAAQPEGAYVHLQSIESDLVNARTGLKKAGPAGRCANCKGGGCKVCRKTGWISSLIAETHPDGVLVDAATSTEGGG